MARWPAPGESLARPKDARNPEYVRRRERALAVFGIERNELDRFRGPPFELLGHDLAAPGADDDPVAAADRRRRRDEDHVAVAIGRLHRLAGYFERVGVFVAHAGECDLVPAFADREAGIVEIAAGAGLRKA